MTPLTSSQAAAVSHRGSDLLLAASAGSGKTEVLTRRCVDLLADSQRPCAVTQLLVVTFTRAAAAELRLRLARLIGEQCDDARLPQARRQHLRRQAALLDLAEIGTIDAWCGRLVRENFEAAGVDPAFRILDELEAEELRDRELDRVFEGLYSGQDATAVAARAWMGRSPRASDNFLREAVGELNRFREHLPDPSAWLGKIRKAMEGSEEAIRSNVRTALAAELRNELRFQIEALAAITHTTAALDAYGDALRTWEAQLRAERSLESVVDAINKYRFPRARRGEADEGTSDVRDSWLKQRLQMYWTLAAVERFLADAPDVARCTLTLLDIESQFNERVSAAKASLGAYEHADIAAAALRLLGRPGENGVLVPTPLARALRERYEHVLVDEYQDTSPIQAEILRLVSRDEPGRGNRFLVGDVKQSIYGFRRAEPRLFAGHARALRERSREGRLQFLSDNFRTHADLLEPLNLLFERLFDERFGGTDYGAQERLRAGRKEEAKPPSRESEPRLRVHLLEAAQPAAHRPDESDGDGEADLERIEREARVAAREIHALIDRGAMQLGQDVRGEPQLRPVAYEDIAILLRSAKVNAGLVAAILRDAGIPSVVCGRETVLDAMEVVDVQNALRLLVNRRQDVPLAAYLRGPLVGLSEPELLAVRRCGPRDGMLMDSVDAFCRLSESAGSRDLERAAPDEFLRRRVAAAMEQLEAWRRVSRVAALPELIRRILRDAELPLAARGMKLGEHRVARLRALQQMAREFSLGERGGLAEFVAFLDRVAESESAPTFTVPAGRGAVRIMTIHAAKGLEYPVVLLLNAGARFNQSHRRAGIVLDAETGIGLRFADRAQRRFVRGAEHLLGVRAVSDRLVEEELRLLYVAATRAREWLFIIGHAPKKDAWSRECEKRRGAPSLLERRAAGTILNWVLMALACDQTGKTTSVLVTTESSPPPVDSTRPEAVARRRPDAGSSQSAKTTLAAADHEWVERTAAELLKPTDVGWSRFPAVLSVSAVKELARRDPLAEHPATLGEPGAESLSRPRWALNAGKAESSADHRDRDGRALGEATHLLLQHADIQKLGTQSGVERELRRLVSAGLLTSDAAERIDVGDIVWLAASELGRLLAGSKLRREVPFVLGIRPESEADPNTSEAECTIVRGLVDCVAETPTGLLLVDYKTDLLGDKRRSDERISAYSVQVRIYAQAMAALMRRPVTRAVLAFLRERRLVDVDVRGKRVVLRRGVDGAAATVTVDRADPGDH